jgi:hypothetical protein
VLVSFSASIRDNDGHLARIGYQVTVIAKMPQDHLRDALVVMFGGSVWQFGGVLSPKVETSQMRAGEAIVERATITSLAAGRADVRRAFIEDLFVVPHVPETRKLIHVRATGSDSNDGSVTSPYRTVQRALRDLPLVLAGQRVFIDCTGIGLEDLPADGFRFPSVIGPGGAVQVAVAFDRQIEWETDVTIAAAPNQVDVIHDYTDALDPDTNLVTLIDPTKSWLPGEHQGRIAVGDGLYETAAILGNTATELSLACDFPLSRPVRIVEPSAELRIAATDKNLEIRSALASVQLYGVKIDAQLELEHTNLSLTCCVVRSVRVASGHVAAFGVTFDSGGIAGRRIRFDGGSALVQYSLIKNLQLDQFRGHWKVLACGFEGCSPVGQGSGSAIGRSSPEDLISPMTFDVEFAIIKGSTDVGLLYLGGPTAYVRRVKIVDAARDAVRARGAGRLVLDACSGSGSAGYGVLVQDGAQVTCEDPSNNEAGPCTVTGSSGDVKVGLLPVRSWNDLRVNAPLGNQFDYRGTGSRLAVHSVAIEPMP